MGNNNTQHLGTLFKILFLSSEYIQRTRFQKTKLKTIIQAFRFKALELSETEKTNTLNTIISERILTNLDILVILKLLQWINFKDSFDQRCENRSIIKNLIHTYFDLKNSAIHLELEDKSYLLTVIIQNIYHYYNLNPELPVNVEKA